MTAFRALLRSQARLRYEPEHIVDALKRMLPEFIGENHFVTSIYGVLDPAKGHFAYVNCGHIAPLLFHAGGGVEQLKTGGPVLSPGLGDSPYRADEIELAPGDLLLLYTDGVVEIEAENGEDFGEERLRAIMQRSLHLPGSEIVRALIRATREFSGSDEYQDDFTLVIVRRT
jgi:sigma-B regulation protein RsbU (phosphoserine phosphatase)